MSAFYNVDQPPFNMGSAARAIAAANNGLLFDIGDMSTMFQDAAGTVPVTAVEQPVGLILDKSGNGNHATQSITASRPVLSARKNVLLATETLATQSVTSVAAQYTLSFTGTGSVTLSGTATGTLTGTGTDNRVSLAVTPTAGTLTLTVSGSVTKAQLELGAVAGSYQRVNTATDYDTNPALFPKYLKFDGVDDYLNLPYMGLYANGSASVVAAMSENKVAYGTTLINETSRSLTAPMYNPTRQSDLGNNWRSLIRNDANVVTLSSTGASINADGHTSVRSRIDSASNTTAFENSINKESYNYTRSGVLTLDKTTIGALLIGGVMGSPNNMKLYGLIITKSALTDAQRVRCERFLARKAGVML